MLVVKNLPANAWDTRDKGSIPGPGRFPGGGNGNLLQYTCSENPPGQRSLAGYSPQGRKELDTTKVTYTHMYLYLCVISCFTLVQVFATPGL